MQLGELTVRLPLVRATGVRQPLPEVLAHQLAAELVEAHLKAFKKAHDSIKRLNELPPADVEKVDEIVVEGNGVLVGAQGGHDGTEVHKIPPDEQAEEKLKPMKRPLKFG